MLLVLSDTAIVESAMRSYWTFWWLALAASIPILAMGFHAVHWWIKWEFIPAHDRNRGHSQAQGASPSTMPILAADAPASLPSAREAHP